MAQLKSPSFAEICADLKSSGISKHEIVLVHSSLRSFGQIAGGATSVTGALIAMGNTVLFPAFTGKITDGKQCPPIMTVTQSPTWTGAIPETARKMPGALRSLHPTHSLVGFGTRAEELLSGHERTHSPCDANSPFYKLVINNAVIVLFGCDHNSNTLVHCCEEMAGVSYHLQTEVTEGVVITADRAIVVANRLHNWQKPPTDFNKIEQLLLTERAITFAEVGQSRVKIIDAGKMYAALYHQLIIQPEFLLV